MFLFQPVLALWVETSIIHGIIISFRQKFNGSIISKETIRYMYRHLRSVNAKDTMDNRDFSIVNFEDGDITNVKGFGFVVSEE